MLHGVIDLVIGFSPTGDVVEANSGGRTLLNSLPPHQRSWQGLPPELIAVCLKVNATHTVETCAASLSGIWYDLSVAPARFAESPGVGVVILGRESSLEAMALRLYAKLAELSPEISPVEAKVCHLLRTCSCTKDVARFLHVSENTVKFHIKNIRRKLGLSGKAASLRQFLFALREGE